MWSPTTASTPCTPSATSTTGPVGSVRVAAGGAHVADRDDRLRPPPPRSRSASALIAATGSPTWYGPSAPGRVRFGMSGLENPTSAKLAPSTSITSEGRNPAGPATGVPMPGVAGGTATGSPLLGTRLADR